MSAQEKIVFCWSGGKDSALALNRILQCGDYEVVSLLTTCNEHFQRVSMHGVRIELLERQAAAIGLPLEKVFVSQQSSNEEYQERMGKCLTSFKERGVTACAFGDIFLEDLRQWREANLAQVGLRALFPLWKIDTRELIREFIDLKFKSIICCINDGWLDESFVGRLIDDDLIASLPPEVDPCGENGEFHSFAFDGPIFRYPVPYRRGDSVYRPLEVTVSANTNAVCPSTSEKRTRGFWFHDLLTDELGRQEQCPLCGGDNACRLGKGHLYKGPCWCEALAVPAPLLKRMAAEWVDPACLCRSCLNAASSVASQTDDMDAALIEIRRQRRLGGNQLSPDDYYQDEDGNTVFTAAYHLKRGTCCQNGCRHCPY
jgi:uncharacterized protein (TIGR00290 family)